jgi:hypothetical protein
MGHKKRDFEVVRLQLERSAFNKPWGMLLIEKNIDFKLAAEGLNLSKYQRLKIVFRILASTPMKFRFSVTSANFVEEQDLDVIFTALKNALLKR